MIISISRCCGPQKIEKILINHKKLKNVNTKCDFRQFHLNSKSYNFPFCVFFVFLTDRKCQPLSSFWKSDGFRWSRNVHMKGKTSQKWSASDFNFGHNQVRDSARELGGSLSFCQMQSSSQELRKICTFRDVLMCPSSCCGKHSSSFPSHNHCQALSRTHK